MTVPRPQPAASGDLFEPAPVARRSHAPKPGIPPWLVAAAALGVAALLWAAWVTKTVLVDGAARPAFASVRLQPIVEEYVQAQARTQSPEAQVTRETQAFMARLDAELKRRGRDGTTVLVAEAVLSKDVPDITAEVRRAVHASSPLPAPAGASGVPGAAR